MGRVTSKAAPPAPPWRGWHKMEGEAGGTGDCPGKAGGASPRSEWSPNNWDEGLQAETSAEHRAQHKKAIRLKKRINKRLNVGVTGRHRWCSLMKDSNGGIDELSSLHACSWEKGGQTPPPSQSKVCGMSLPHEVVPGTINPVLILIMHPAKLDPF